MPQADQNRVSGIGTNWSRSPTAPRRRTLPAADLYGVLRYWATETPMAPAVVGTAAECLSYQDLLKAVDGIGADLARLGLGRSDRIAVVHPGGNALAVILHGIWCHATVAPLNPGYTVGEFALYLRDLGVRAVAIARGLETPARHAAERLGLPVLDIQDHSPDGQGTPAIDGAPVGPARSGNTSGADDVALLLTTSGTTSQSKIVPIRQRQFLARCRNVADRLELKSSDRCLNPMPLYHSHGLNSGLGVPLLSGGSVIALGQFNIRRFYGALGTLAPSWYTAVFTFHHQIHAHAQEFPAHIGRARLRLIHTSSGRLDPKVAEEMETTFDCPLLGTLATTETGIIAGDAPPPAIRKRGSVGTAAGCEIAIRDSSGTALPAGQNGEVCVRGANVFDGYVNDPQATRAALSDGWFRTGDEGMLDPDGFLHLTGRVKETINRGGEKVSPSEVDSILLEHPDVAAAAAFPIPHATLGEEVAAAVVRRPGSSPTERDLTRFLLSKLSGFKVPRRICFVDDIPKGPTGKVQRHTLAATLGLDLSPTDAARATQDDSRGPTPLEAELTELWRDTLGIAEVGLRDDFFLLGGDSLQAVELFLRIEKHVGRRLPRSILFEASTVAEMARRIGDEAAPGCLVPIQPDGNRTPFFCVHGIDGGVLYFRDLARHLGSDRPFYGVQATADTDRDMPFLGLEDMVRRYLEDIRKVQLAGPYLLGGYSFGGWAAFEMARQLKREGERVALLAIIDTHCPNGRPGVPLRTRLAWSKRRMFAPATPMPAVATMRQALLAKIRLRGLAAAAAFGPTRTRAYARLGLYPAESHGIVLRRYKPK
ncbi:MAG: non-ribosomal peptide synthetase, partial [Pseudomonadota bacterium]